MPGTLVSLSVQPGQKVTPGDEVRLCAVGLLLCCFLFCAFYSGMPRTQPTHQCLPHPKHTHPHEQVAVVEAMKMRNVLRAELEGVVASVEAQKGAVLAADQVIVRFE